jgi:hypothetical protein
MIDHRATRSHRGGQGFESPQLHFKGRFRTRNPAYFGRRTAMPAIELPPYRLSAFARRRAKSQSRALSVAEDRRRRAHESGHPAVNACCASPPASGDCLESGRLARTARERWSTQVPPPHARLCTPAPREVNCTFTAWHSKGQGANGSEPERASGRQCPPVREDTCVDRCD